MTMMPTTRWRFGKREVGPPSRAWTGQIRLGACGEDIPMGAACNRYYRHHHPHSHSHHLHHHHHHHHHHQIIIIILIIIIWMIIIILIIDCHFKNTLPFALFCWSIFRGDYSVNASRSIESALLTSKNFSLLVKIGTRLNPVQRLHIDVFIKFELLLNKIFIPSQHHHYHCQLCFIV